MYDIHFYLIDNIADTQLVVGRINNNLYLSNIPNINSTSNQKNMNSNLHWIEYILKNNIVAIGVADDKIFVLCYYF